MGWKILAVTLITLSTLIPFPTFAGGFAGNARITEVYVPVDGRIAMFQVNPDANVNPENCGGTAYVLERDAVGQEAFRMIVTQLTTAMLARIPVTMWIEGCSSTAYWGTTLPLISDIRLHAE